MTQNLTISLLGDVINFDLDQTDGENISSVLLY